MEKYLVSNELKIKCIDKPVYYGKTVLMKYSTVMEDSLKDTDPNIKEIELKCQSYDLCLLLRFLDECGKEDFEVPQSLKDKIRLTRISDYLDIEYSYAGCSFSDVLFSSFSDLGLTWGDFYIYSKVKNFDYY